MSYGRWRIYLIAFLLLGAFFIITPTVINLEKAPFWVSKIMHSKKLKLGLDLQGGLYLVMGVDVDKVVLEYSDRNVDRLSNALKEEGVSIDKVKRIGDTSKISIKFNNLNDSKKIRDTVSKYTGMIYVASRSYEIIFDLKKDNKDFIKRRAVDQTIEAIRNRIDEFGVSEPSIQSQGGDRILIQLPGVKDPARAKSIIGRTARLEFKLVKTDPDFGPNKINDVINRAKEAGIVFEEGKTYSDYVDRLNKFAEKKLPENSMILFERKLDPATGKKLLVPYLLEKTTPVTGDHLKDAYVGFSSDFSEPYVSFQMNTMGARFMGDLTGKNIGKQLAIVLDKNVYSAPVIKDKISDSGQITLGGGRSLNKMQEEAEDIALVLRAGALPAQLVFEEERTVGPTLGRDSIEKGKLSMILGSILVLLFMLFYYRASGLVADMALFMNVLLIASILILFEATLTLPGIAGIVLTVGMCVDANVIVFERIREELRLGNAVKAAIEMGYAKALWTILDANITTAIAGIVLLQYGTGPVRGFAVTLLIGIACSVFTAVYVSKWIFEFVMSRRTIRQLSI